MFLSQGEIILEGDPKELPGQYGKRTLEDLFVSVAREPMDWGSVARMNLSRLAAIPLRQFYLYRGSAARVVPLFAWVTVDMVLWGFMTKFLGGLSQTNYRFVPALLGAVLFWDFMTRVMQGVTTAFFEDVWSRNFLNVFASPITVPEYIGGLLVVERGHEPGGAGGDGDRGRRWRSDCRFASYGVMLIPFIAGAVSVWNGVGRGGDRDRAATGAGSRMVCVADSCHPFTVRCGVLSAGHAACPVAMDGADAAAVVCV